MRRLIHIFMSPACRVARLALAEKRVPHNLVAADDPLSHLPVLVEDDGAALTGLWAIIDHLEAEHPDHPLLPEDAAERAEALRLFDWLMTHFFETVTKRILWEKAVPAQTGAVERKPPSMETLRRGRDELH